MGDLNTRTGNEDSLHEKLGNQLGHLLPKIERTTQEENYSSHILGIANG